MESTTNAFAELDLSGKIARATAQGHVPTPQEIAWVESIGYREDGYAETDSVRDYGRALGMDSRVKEMTAKYAANVKAATKGRLALVAGMSSGEVNRDAEKTYGTGHRYEYADSIRVEIAGTGKEVFTFREYDAEERLQIMLVAFVLAK